MTTASAPRGRRGAASAPPTCETELALARDHPALDRGVVVAGVDEVGRGALAGPVTVGACAVRIGSTGLERELPAGVRDSKALTALRRERLVAPIRESAHAHALGWASAAEIDEHGIVPALTLAAGRAIAALRTVPDIVLMDGDVDVITPALGGQLEHPPAVHLRVRADRDCASVAAASVLAKVARDQHMAEIHALAPEYGWAGNKGYGSAAHREALRTRGAHSEHRRSWNLGVPDPVQEPGVLWGRAGEDPAPRTPKEAQP
jgi:ribonuclease HII